MYKKGEHIVYRKDICLIQDIVDMRGEKYYCLLPLCDESLSLKIPVDNKSGLIRPVITKEEAEKLIIEMNTIDTLDINEKLLTNEYQKLMASPSIEDLVKIVKTTYIRNNNRLKNGKKLGEKDDQYFKKAEKLLFMELSVSLGMEYKDARQYVLDKLKKTEKNISDDDEL